MSMTPASVDALRALCLGFALAGLLTSLYEMVTSRPCSFRLLRSGDATAFASVPVLVFTAPFVIIRNLLRGSRKGQRPFMVVFVATIIAGFWSLACGRVVLDAATRLVGA